MIPHFLIKYGVANSPIEVVEYRVRCPCCESDEWADVMIVSNYYFFSFLPIFPCGKEANVICKKCGCKRYGAAFDSKLISNYEEVKKNYKHPLFTYLGVALAAFPFVVVIIYQLIVQVFN